MEGITQFKAPFRGGASPNHHHGRITGPKFDIDFKNSRSYAAFLHSLCLSLSLSKEKIKQLITKPEYIELSQLTTDVHVSGLTTQNSTSKAYMHFLLDGGSTNFNPPVCGDHSFAHQLYEGINEKRGEILPNLVDPE